jgi:hypothetical protein
LAWNVQNPPKRAKSLFFWPETSKIPLNGTNPYSSDLKRKNPKKRGQFVNSFGLKRSKSPQTGKILTLLAWNVQNPANGPNHYSFAMKPLNYPKLVKSLFFWHKVSKILTTW